MGYACAKRYNGRLGHFDKSEVDRTGSSVLLVMIKQNCYECGRNCLFSNKAAKIQQCQTETCFRKRGQMKKKS